VIAIESLRIAVQGILANRLRSLLTMLGVMIGVAAVIILVAVGTGSAAAVQNQLQSLGTNVLTVFSSRGFGFGRGGGASGGRSTIGTQSRAGGLTLKDVAALQKAENAPDLKSVNPVVNAQVTATYQDATYQPGQFVGTTPGYFEAENYKVAAGRALTDADVQNHAPVVELGTTVVQNLFGSANPIGETIAVNGVQFQVIGVLASKGNQGLLDQDDVAIAPYTSVQGSLTGVTGTLNQIVTEAKSSKVTTQAENEITTTLLSTHKITNGQPDFQVLNQASFISASNASHRTFTVLLGAVAAISLLVGGIGVMNIMLVTVTERTREIGIRKAIGARRVHIVGQFMVEAVLLSMIGGLIGVAAGLIGSRFTIVGIQPVVAPYSVVLAFSVSAVVGLVFGIYPAARAAALRPIEALRYE
jgi:putative ABC transport system permease protein